MDFYTEYSKTGAVEIGLKTVEVTIVSVWVPSTPFERLADPEIEMTSRRGKKCLTRFAVICFCVVPAAVC